MLLRYLSRSPYSRVLIRRAAPRFLHKYQFVRNFSSYHEDRKLIEDELTEDLKARFDAAKSEVMKEKFARFWGTLNELPLERRLHTIKILRAALNSEQDKPFDFQHPPEWSNEDGHRPNVSPEAQREFEEMLKEITTPAPPRSPEAKAKAPQTLPEGWNTLSEKDIRRALNDPSFTKMLKEEENIGDEVIDELMNRLDMIEKFKDTPEADDMMMEMMDLLGIEKGQTIEDVNTFERVDTEQIWEKMLQKMKQKEEKDKYKWEKPKPKSDDPNANPFDTVFGNSPHQFEKLKKEAMDQMIKNPTGTDFSNLKTDPFKNMNFDELNKNQQTEKEKEKEQEKKEKEKEKLTKKNQKAKNVEERNNQNSQNKKEIDHQELFGSTTKEQFKNIEKGNYNYSDLLKTTKNKIPEMDEFDVELNDLLRRIPEKEKEKEKPKEGTKKEKNEETHRKKTTKNKIPEMDEFDVELNDLLKRIPEKGKPKEGTKKGKKKTKEDIEDEEKIKEKEKAQQDYQDWMNSLDPKKTKEIEDVLCGMMAGSGGSLDGLLEAVEKEGGTEALLKRFGLENNPFGKIWESNFDPKSGPMPWPPNKK